MNQETKEKLISEMESYFGKDRRRIRHARKVLEHAEELLKKERGSGANECVVTSAAVLHDIGIHACEKKYGLTAGHLQEKEGPPIARRIMEKLNFEEDVIKEVCDIIASHHSPGEVDTSNFRILYEADRLVNLEGA